MKEFLSAAAPWLVIGTAVAVILAFASRGRSHSAGSEDSPPPDNYMTEGLCLGMCLGVVLGLTALDNLAAGLSLGMCVGLAIGCSIKRKPQE